MLCTAPGFPLRPGLAGRAAVGTRTRVATPAHHKVVSASGRAASKLPWALRKRGPGKQEVFYELEGDGGVVLVGRAGAEQGCNVNIDDETISGRHCEISLSTKQCSIRDLNSTNGTSVNGRLLRKGGRSPLREGDSIKLGDLKLDLVILSDDDEDEDEADEEGDEQLEKEDEEESTAESPAVAPRLRKTAADIDPKDVTLGKKIGIGSFGTVFRGEWLGEDIVLKQANRTVESAEDLLELELLLNKRAMKQAPRACADFVGAARVDKANAGNVYNGKLQEGLWLAWRYQGYRTLSSYLKRPASMAQELLDIFGINIGKTKTDNRGRVATVMVMRQLLESLQRLHKVGIVHRDVKPDNILLAADDDTRQIIRLIDLGGAAACLEEPLSYSAGLGSFDPLYAPPEQFLLPDDAPAPNFLTARLLWARYAPELFDTYSAGIVLLQLALPKLRTDAALRVFRDQLTGVDNDLAAWRESYGSSLKDDDILTADDALGWDLAQRLLTAERVPKRGKKQGRMTAKEALAHPFLEL